MKRIQTLQICLSLLSELVGLPQTSSTAFIFVLALLLLHVAISIFTFGILNTDFEQSIMIQYDRNHIFSHLVVNEQFMNNLQLEIVYWNLSSALEVAKYFNIQLLTQQTRKSNSTSHNCKCYGQLLYENKIIRFCEKRESLLAQFGQAQFSYDSNPSFYSIYTSKSQDVHINFTVSLARHPSFALFGLQSQIQITSSDFKLQIVDFLSNGVLICFQCALNASDSDFIFITQGANISGLILNSGDYFTLLNIFLQFRLNGSIISGLISQNQLSQIIVSETNISGFGSGFNIGGIFVSISTQTTVFAQNVQICVQGLTNNGMGLIISGTILENCEICDLKYFAFGICATEVENGVVKDKQIVCKEGFNFDGLQCSCQGQIIGGECITLACTKQIII
ncbi:Hypothetical_protein [Hexamita inflata]|uniref:Hypothetical_protein n=1 Tax=Hexamita inflata TaxID=28002 RepID=A0AA86TN68_9EUKA|nr:Hypothetical protein HINF_LOCUS11354 [Hexamita inflata]